MQGNGGPELGAQKSVKHSFGGLYSRCRVSSSPCCINLLLTEEKGKKVCRDLNLRLWFDNEKCCCVIHFLLSLVINLSLLCMIRCKRNPNVHWMFSHWCKTNLQPASLVPDFILVTKSSP